MSAKSHLTCVSSALSKRCFEMRATSTINWMSMVSELMPMTFNNQRGVWDFWDEVIGLYGACYREFDNAEMLFPVEL